MKVGGCVWKFGDNIDTDVMAPGKYLMLDIKQIAQHTLEAVDPRFAREVKPGDIVLGGRNFGCGSSREHAPRVLKILGVSAVLATSFARIFYRNCAAIGLPMLTVPGLWSETEAGDRVDADLSTGVVVNGRSGNAYQANPIPDRLLAVIMEGGIGPALRRIAAEHRARQR